MNTSINNTQHLKDILTNDIQSSLGIAHNASLYIQQKETLSVKGFAKIQTVLASISSAMRTLIILNDISLKNEDNNYLKKSYCNIDNFFNSMVNELNSIFAAGTDVSFKYSSKFEKKRTFYININEIEKTLYSLIYCLVKNLNKRDKKEIKISIDETVGKKSSYIITITSKGKPLDKKLISIFNEENTKFIDFYDLDALSLLNVRKNIEAFGASITYTSTKTMNKFIFRLPHSTELNQYSEYIPYTPDTDFIRAYFYELLV